MRAEDNLSPSISAVRGGGRREARLILLMMEPSEAEIGDGFSGKHDFGQLSHHNFLRRMPSLPKTGLSPRDRSPAN